MSDLRNCYGDPGIGPPWPIEMQSQRAREREAAAIFAKHGNDGACRVCRGHGFADTDGVYGTCWACGGAGGRGAATTGGFRA